MKLEQIGRLETGLPRNYLCRAFVSVVPRHDGYAFALREWDPDASAVIDRTQLVAGLLDVHGRIVTERVLGPGEDPRLFTGPDGKLKIWSWCYDGERDWKHKIIDWATGNDLLVDVPRMTFYGKNWIPVQHPTRTVVIRSLDPLVVLEYENCWRFLQGENATLSQNIGEYRGGSQALWLDDRIVGWGHRTIDLDHHSVFRYSIDTRPLSWSVEIESVSVDWNYSISDPTAAWGERVVCVGSDGRWDRPKKFEHGIFLVTA